MNNPIICTSQHLRTTSATKQVAEELCSALDRLGIESMELANTNDYWCRDYMPVPLFCDGSYSLYQYCPDYLWDYKSKRKYITEQKEACKSLRLFTPNNMRVVFDGGNYVRCGDKVIMTDKVFAENPECSANVLLQQLQESLCADIVIVPWDTREPYGHADGMVAPLDDGRLLLNNYVQDARHKAFYRRLHKILDAHFDVVDLSYDCELDLDSWCYLNFLNLPNAILLPALSEDHLCANDKEAIRVFECLFPGKEIVPIYASPLVKKGGALHCVTWEYIPQRNELIP